MHPYYIVLIVVVLLDFASSSRTARHRYERLLQLGDKEHLPLVGACGIAHAGEDKPPAFAGNDGCLTLCTFDAIFVDRSGDAVTLKYSLADGGTSHIGDRIELYDVGAPMGDYLEYFKATITGNARGQRTLNLYNLRTPLHFRYIRPNFSDLSGDQCLCESKPVVFSLGPDEPTQGHLSLTGDPTEMQITWVSAADHSGFVEVEGVGRFESEAARYDAIDMCGYPANASGPWAYRDIGWIHTTTMKGLKQNTSYSYRYGHAGAVSSWVTFRTEPDWSHEWHAIAYGDMGVTSNNVVAFWEGANGAQRVQRDTFEKRPHLVVHLGDLSYARSVGFLWEMWAEQISPLARTAPYMVSLGNHEYDHIQGADKDPSGEGLGFHPSWGNYGDDSLGECGVPVVKRFPNPPRGGFGIFWYSYNYANTHWVMLSSEHDYTKGAAQFDWFVADLAKVNRTKTPWVIVTAHRPAYNSEMYAGDYNVSVRMAAELDDILVMYKVNLFLAGHYHAYQRTCAVAHRECQGDSLNPVAPVHVTVGAAGAPLDSVGIYPEGSRWTVRTIFTFGYLLLRVRQDKIVAEFWGIADPYQPGLPLQILDAFELFPFSQA